MTGMNDKNIRLIKRSHILKTRDFFFIIKRKLKILVFTSFAYSIWCAHNLNKMCGTKFGCDFVFIMIPGM